MHGSCQSRFCKSLESLEIIAVGVRRSEPLCPRARGVRQFVAAEGSVVTSVFALGYSWPDGYELAGEQWLESVEKLEAAGNYSAPAAASFFRVLLELSGICGSAAINRRVYSCCGLVKICSLVPHSTILPS